MTTYTYEKLLSWSREKLRPWQQDALRRVLQGEVSDADIRALAEIALSGVVGGEEPRAEPANASHVPPSGESLPQVAVRGLREIERANALGPGPIVFAETGLTVIYGENASGKSGFSRILKKACRARVPGPTVRGNVFEPISREPAKATVDFSVDGTPDSTGWVDGSPSRDELALVTVFDADCAKWQVDRPNVIEYTPELLAVFRDLAAVFRRVETALRSEKSRLPKRPTLLDELQMKLATGTLARAFLGDLSAESDPDELARLSVLNHAERERTAELADVLRVDPAAQGREEEARGRRVRDLGALCQALGALVSEGGSERLASRIQEVADSEEAVRTARAVLSGQSVLEGVGGEIWRRLWEAARGYSEQVAFPGEEFPVLRDGAGCLLCQRPLDDEARGRFRSFEQFIQGEVQQRSEKARAALDASVESIRGMAIPKRSKDAARNVGLADTEEGCGIRLFLISVKRRRLYLLRLAAGRVTGDCPTLSLGPDLGQVRTAIDGRVRTLQAAANAEGRGPLVAEQNELSARAALSSYHDDVASEISRLQVLAVLDAALPECNTQRVTLEQGIGPGYEREARDVYSELRQTWERGVEEVLLNGAVLRFGQAIETQKLRKAAGDLRIEDIEKVDEEMSYCSKFMHDPPGNVSRERPPGPDIVEADIKKLDDWAKAVRQRRG